MAKAKAGSKKNPVNQEELNNGRPYVILQATIKEGLCNYQYQITSGDVAHDAHNVKGKGIVDEDMRTAFGNLSVHMAYMDEAFKMSGLGDKDIDDLKTHDLSFKYRVKEIKIKKTKAYEAVTLVGEKHLDTVSGWADIVMPEVVLDNLSGYKFYNELIRDVEHLREEVALYKEGKYTLPETDIPVAADNNQASLFEVKNEEELLDAEVK
jgi:hypothetical protein